MESNLLRFEQYCISTFHRKDNYFLYNRCFFIFLFPQVIIPGTLNISLEKSLKIPTNNCIYSIYRGVNLLFSKQLRSYPAPVMIFPEAFWNNSSAHCVVSAFSFAPVDRLRYLLWPVVALYLLVV